MSISKAVLTGKVVRDPEKRFTTSNLAVTTFSINVDSQKSTGLNIARVITWRNLAETCAESIKKGQTVIVDGRLQINSYKDANGQDRKAIEIDASNVEILSGMAKTTAPPKDKDLTDDVPPPSAEDYNITPDDLINEEEIPF